MFDINIDTSNGCIHIAMRGFWTTDTVPQYFKAKDAAMDKMIASGCAERDVKILFDIREWETQAREVTEMIDAVEDNGVRGAVIAQSAMLPRKQSQRLAGDNYQFFATKEEALKWLLNDQS